MIESPVIPSLEGMREQRARTKLSSFIQYAWPVLEPGKRYQSNWHIDAIAEHLSAVTTRQIKRLIINQPPRSLKSVSASVMWPVWTWINNPGERFLFASYSFGLSIKHSVDRRSLIRSDWFQQNWGSVFQLSKDQDEKHEFTNNHRGVMTASSVGGPPFGKGGDILVADDILDPEQAASDVECQRANDFFDRTFSTRLNDPKTGAIVIIMQRLRDTDLTAHVLEHEKWDQLVLPMAYEGSKYVTSLGWSDPRTEFGQLLHPARFGQAELDSAKLRLGPAFSGQMQQRPSPEEGGRIKRHWWRYWQFAGQRLPAVPVRLADGKLKDIEPEELPTTFDEVVDSWDMAFKSEETSDFVAGQKWGRSGADCYLLERDTRRMDFPETMRAVQALANKFPHAGAKLVEDKANGSAVIQMMRHQVKGLIAINPDGGKMARVNAVAPQIEAGNVYLPHPQIASWVSAFIDELASFPNGAHDDDVDSCSQALKRLGVATHTELLPQFSRSQHVKACTLKTWWPRWISLSYGQECAAHWFAVDPEQNVYVYRELAFSAASAEDFAGEVAHLTTSELAHQKALTAFCSNEDYFERGGTRSVAQQLVGGFASVLGMEAAFIWAYTDEERAMPQDRAMRSLQLRRQKAQATRMVIQHVKGDEQAAWEHARSLMGKPIAHSKVVGIDYDRDFALKLLDADNPHRLQQFDNYIKAVNGELPTDAKRHATITVDPECAHAIDAMSAATHDEKNHGYAAQSGFGAILDSLAAGFLAHRQQLVVEPMQEYVARKVADVPAGDGQGAVMAARKAEADWKKQNAGTQGFSFRRASTQRARL